MYLLFGGSEFYPSGGADDYMGSYEYVDQAKAAWAKHLDGDKGEYKWAHIAETSLSPAILGLPIVCEWWHSTGWTNR